MSHPVVWIMSLLLLGHLPTGMPKPGVYTDPKAGITFSYPVELQPNQDFTQRAMAKTRVESTGDAEAIKTLECLTIPLTAVENAKTPRFGVLVFSDLDMNCRSHKGSSGYVNDLVQGELQAALGKLGTPEMGKTAAYVQDGGPAAVAEGIVPADKSISKAIIYGESACMLHTQHAFCWTAFGISRERVREILGGQVSFRGQPASTLVPAGALAQL